MKPLRILRVLTLVIAATLAGFFLYAAIRRLFYPYELEWMTGSILDHIERVRSGQPLYVAPTGDWIPFMYPPLYYWVAAAVSKVLPEIIACRGISIVATLAQAAMLWPLARRAGASRFWASIGMGLFFATYSFTAFWYDIERCDSLFMAMIVASTLIVARTKGIGGAIAAGAVLGAAFFCKQPATLFVLAAAAALWLGGQRPRALALAGVGGAVILVGTLWLNARSGGWFSYYVWKMPATHGFDHRMVYPLFIQDLPRAGLLVGATVALCASWRRVREAPLIPAMLAAAFFASATSRMHAGGWSNVLAFWTVYACAAFAIVATRVEESARGSAWERHIGFALVGVAVVQFGLFGWDPEDPVPRPFRHQKAAELVRTLRSLDAEGEVLVMGTGHVSAHRHFHAAALVDVIRTDGKPPEQLLQALAQRRFAAIVLDDPEELDFHGALQFDCDMERWFLANYYFSERIDDRMLPPIVGYHAHPSWVLRPRREPLGGRSREALERRQRIEMGLASLRMEAQRGGGAVTFDAKSIEDVARSIEDGTIRPPTALAPAR
jgi:hypothetical protein